MFLNEKIKILMKSKLNRLASEIKFQFLNLTANCLPVEALTEVGKLLVRRSFSGGEQTANLLILILKISRVNKIIIIVPIKLGMSFVNPSLTFKKKPLAITPDVIAINKNKYDISKNGGYVMRAVHSGMSCFHALRRDLKEYYNFNINKH